MNKEENKKRIKRLIDYRRLTTGVRLLADNLIKDGKKQIFKSVYGLEVNDKIECKYVGTHSKSLTVGKKYTIVDHQEINGIIYVYLVNDGSIYNHYNLEKYFKLK